MSARIPVARVNSLGQVVDRQNRPLATVEELLAATHPDRDTARQDLGIYVLGPDDADNDLPPGSVVIRRATP